MRPTHYEHIATNGFTTVTRLVGVIVLVGWCGFALAQTSPAKQTEAQQRVQQKILQQKKLECAKLGKYAVASTIRGTTLYKCAARPNG